MTTRPVTAETARAFSGDLDRMSRETGVRCFLTDVRGAPNVSGITRNYNYAYEDMTELGLQRDVRSAVPADPDDPSHDFVETVAQNAGYNVRVFRDEQAAIDWLEAGVAD